MRTLNRLTTFVLRAAAIMLLATLTWAAQQPPRPDLPANPADLVRKAVAHQKAQDADKTHYMYRLTKKKPERTETREIIETDQGVIGRLLMIDGKPLTPDDRVKEDKRLQRLVTDSQQLAQKQRSQQEDDRRARTMVAALPDAFLYEYAGTKNEEPWGEVVMLKFNPNPDFEPPQRETMVYRGMQGTMAIAVPANRFARIDAHLFRDVNFGWGILAHLDQGGSFMIEQKAVESSNGAHWEPSHMVLHFTGKALIFKSIKINDDEATTDIRPVHNMTAAQAIDLLKKHDGAIAENSGSK